MDFKFIDIDGSVFSTDPDYDLLHGGYIDPEKLLKDEKQAEQVNEAIEIIKEFLKQAENEGIIEIG